MPQGAPTHKFEWPLNIVVLRVHVTNQIHYISTCKRPMDTKLVKILNYSENLRPLNSFTWSTWGHVTIWKIYVSALPRLIAINVGMMLTLARRFSTETLKSPPTSCFLFHRLLLFFQIGWFYMRKMCSDNSFCLIALMVFCDICEKEKMHYNLLKLEAVSYKNKAKLLIFFSQAATYLEWFWNHSTVWDLQCLSQINVMFLTTLKLKVRQGSNQKVRYEISFNSYWNMQRTLQRVYF